MKLLRSLSKSTQLSLGCLSLVWDLTMNTGFRQPCTNRLGVGAALLMSPKKGKISQYKSMKLWRDRLGLMKVPV